MRYVFCIFILIVFGCETGREAEINELREEVNGFHDEVMPLMGPLYKTRQSLQSLVEVDSSKLELSEAIVEIEAVEESMMDWMRNYDPNFKGTENEVIQYLSDKKSSIEKVASRMNSSLNTGKEILKSHENLPSN